MKFSDKLVIEYQECMKNDYGHEVTDEDAQLHLASLARLFTAYSKGVVIKMIPSGLQHNLRNRLLSFGTDSLYNNQASQLNDELTITFMKDEQIKVVKQDESGEHDLRSDLKLFLNNSRDTSRSRSAESEQPIPLELLEDKNFIETLLEVGVNDNKLDDRVQNLISKHIEALGGVDSATLECILRAHLPEDRKQRLFNYASIKNEVASVPPDVLTQDYIIKILDQEEVSFKVLDGLVRRKISESGPLDGETMERMFEKFLRNADRNAIHDLIITFFLNSTAQGQNFDTNSALKIYQAVVSGGYKGHATSFVLFLDGLNSEGLVGKFFTKDFLTECIRIDPLFYQEINDRRRQMSDVFSTGSMADDRELLREAINLYGAEQYRHCPNHLWGDLETIKYVLSLNGELINVIPDDFKTNPELKALAENAPKSALTNAPRPVTGYRS